LNPKVKVKQSEEISYNQALVKGLIIEGRVKESPAPEFDLPIHRYRNTENLTPKQLEDLKRL